VGIGALGWYFLTRPSDALPSGQLLVNVVTGDVKTANRRNLAILPAPDESGVRVWYPAVKRDGKVVVIERYQDYLTDHRADLGELRVDPNTFELLTKP